MTARRKAPEPPPTPEVPSLLRRGPRAFIEHLPPAFNKGPTSWQTILAARALRDVAQRVWWDATGTPVQWRGRPWGSVPDDCPPALRKAGERLAADLLRQ